MPEDVSAPLAGHADHMDRMYRYTRHVYDASRKYFLLGRDLLLKKMAIKPGDRVLEMGCGTARNLIKLAKNFPSASYYGLDASNSMLETAKTSVEKRGLSDKIDLKFCYAEKVEHQATFGLADPFDVIFFSYSLSMMPTWPQAIDAALANLKPAGKVYIVDFWDQAELPKAFGFVLKKFLAAFHVHHRPELMEYLKKMEADKRCTLEIQPLFGRYAYIAALEPMPGGAN
jgi:S-adenosylmethionine-diacylgycerolhomoserine-N-methlytransferase